MVCEDSLEEAIKTFLNEAKIPVPEDWSTTKDRAVVKFKIVPAFIKALERIEKVDYCYGFDSSKVDPLGTE